MQQFNVQQVPIKGVNLIEASAGTGKTYSIAILILRAIVSGVENDQGHSHYPSLDRMLVATFTKAAVAELQERIRLFIYKALQYLQHEIIDDPLIQSIIDEQKNIEEITNISKRIQSALYTMDEAHITSIHGFSQRMLQEFAFETHYAANSVVLKDSSTIIMQIVHEFWRKEITTLPLELLRHIDLDNLRSIFQQVITNTLATKIYYHTLIDKPTISIDTAKAQIEKSIKEKEHLLESISSQLQFDYEGIRNEINKVMARSPKAFEPNLTAENMIASVQHLYSKNNKSVLKLTGGIWDMILQYINIDHCITTIIDQVTITLNKLLIHEYVPLVQQRLKEMNAYTYDKLIQQLYTRIVTDNNQRLIALIRSKYDIIFIDEFQDTDIIQFEIFNQLFIQSKDNIVFLIGDPKQSIYAFRNADIDSYLHAKHQVDHIYSMSRNFRSSQQMLQAVNHIYADIGLSEAFGYAAFLPVTDKIQYEIIEPNNLNQEILLHHTPIASNLNFIGDKNKSDVTNSVIQQIKSFLHRDAGYQIWDKKNQQYRTIRPSDIGILSMTKHDGASVKDALEQINIPAVQIRENTIFETAEATEFTYILAAMLQPTLPNIRRALYNTLLNIHHQTSILSIVDSMDEHAALSLFYQYQQLLSEATLLPAFNKLMDDFSLRQHYQHTTMQLRIISNFEQVLQLCHEQQYRKSWNAQELLLWVQQNITQANSSEDSYLTQMESDEDAVKIVTIHKSKGLEYNIVFVVGIEKPVEINTRHHFIDFKTSDSTHKLFLETNSALLTDSQLAATIQEQLERERYRLIYVAITRAVFACYIHYTVRSIERSVLSTFIQAAHASSSPYVQGNISIEENDYSFDPTASHTDIPIIQLNAQRLMQARSPWRKMSFTSLSIHEPMDILDNTLGEDPYDQYIFKALPRGAKAGIALHSLMEHVDYNIAFNNYEALHFYQKNVINRFLLDNNFEVDMLPMSILMLQHLQGAYIQFADTHFTLKDLDRRKMIHELAFNFNVDTGLALASLIQILSEHHIHMQIDSDQLIGMMNGFIDLFFEHEGKYYILDWKSNYLGNSITNYEAEALELAMQHNHYNLQYSIYTVAAIKFLQSRMTDFDYDTHFGGIIYIFVRGARAGSTTGIYTHRPEAAFIQKVTALLTPSHQIA